MNRHRVLLADVAAQPWRNGGGVTRELLAWPRAADWELRVSVATIEHDGPFSPFQDVDRWFAVIEGAGVELAWASGARALRPGDPPLHFAGEAAPGCRLLQGPTHDLNFMHRRGAGAARMLSAPDGSRLDGSAGWRALYAADAALVDLGEQTEALAAGTLLWASRSDLAPPGRPWQLLSAGRAWWLTLETR